MIRVVAVEAAQQRVERVDSRTIRVEPHAHREEDDGQIAGAQATIRQIAVSRTELDGALKALRRLTERPNRVERRPACVMQLGDVLRARVTLAEGHAEADKLLRLLGLAGPEQRERAGDIPARRLLG